MIMIRRGTFETNSSSTHALCIKKEIPKNLPKEIYFGLGCFGWEKEKSTDMTTKATYLHTAILDCYSDDEDKYNNYKNNITNILREYGIESKWEEPKKSSNGNYDWYDYYIDHSYEMESLLEIIPDQPQLLIEWLCNDESWLVTDNDNSDMEYFDWALDKFKGDDYYVYVKGN